METLPSDVQRAIFAEIVDTNPAMIASLMLCCRSWHEAAKPLLDDAREKKPFAAALRGPRKLLRFFVGLISWSGRTWREMDALEKAALRLDDLWDLLEPQVAVVLSKKGRKLAMAHTSPAVLAKVVATAVWPWQCSCHCLTLSFPKENVRVLYEYMRDESTGLFSRDAGCSPAHEYAFTLLLIEALESADTLDLALRVLETMPLYKPIEAVYNALLIEPHLLDMPVWERIVAVVVKRWGNDLPTRLFWRYCRLDPAPIDAMSTLCALADINVWAPVPERQWSDPVRKLLVKLRRGEHEMFTPNKRSRT